MKVQLNDAVADTLFIPLCMKCRETRRKDALLHDPWACEMIAKMEYDFSRYSKSVMSFTGVAIRASYFDLKVKEFMRKVEKPVIVLIGCGLDTRYHRAHGPHSEAVF